MQNTTENCITNNLKHNDKYKLETRRGVYNIVGQIKEVIEKYYDDKPQKDYSDGLPSASMIGGCPRVAFATINNVQKTTPPDVHAMQNFEVGNVTESVVARAMDKAGILLDWWTDSQNYGATFSQKDWKGNLRDDKWTDEELKITGTPDCICKVEDKVVLVDVKTASTKSVPFTLRKIKAGNYWEESYGYKMQLGCYMLLMERRFETGLEKYKPDYGKLVIVDKNNGSIIAEPTLSMTDGLRAEVKNRIEYLNQLLQETDAREIPCTCATGWMRYFGTAYCNYGELDSLKANKQKKVVPTRCCNPQYINNQLKKNNAKND